MFHSRAGPGFNAAPSVACYIIFTEWLVESIAGEKSLQTSLGLSLPEKSSVASFMDKISML